MKKLGPAILISLFTSIALAATLVTSGQPLDFSNLTVDQKSALEFIDSVGYNTENIVELDILKPKTSFIFKDSNGDICTGDVHEDFLRCKNAQGVVGFLHDGDAD